MEQTTEFQNPPIPPDSLPDYAAVELTPAASGYLPYAIFNTAWFWLLLVVISLFGNHIPGVKVAAGPWLTGGLILVMLLSVLHNWIDARRRGWALRRHDLIYRAGVLWRRTVILPFARIQHVETASGPVERLFGLMRVKCFTAGGSNADLTMLGLDAERARRVRAYLLEQIRDDGGSSAGADEESEPAI